MQQWGYHAKPNPQDHGAMPARAIREDWLARGRNAQKTQCTKTTKSKTIGLNGKGRGGFKEDR
jgi:hypothetical protein